MEINQNKSYSLDELSARYPRQWLAVTVTERDENGQPVRASLLTREIDVFTARNNAGGVNFCTMYTGSIPEVNHVGMF